MARIIFPIWKKTKIRITENAKRASYSIYYFAYGLGDRKLIFKGKAFAKPAQPYINIIPNDLLAGFNINFPLLPIGEQRVGAFANFADTYFTIEVEGEPTPIEIQPVYDYSYKNTPTELLLNRMLSTSLRKDGVREVDARQLVEFSLNSPTKISITADYGGVIEISNYGSCNAFIDLRRFPYNPTLRINGVGSVDYKVVQSCCRYCLHYVNKIGGWDSILMNGKNNTSSESYERKSIKGEFILGSVEETGKIYYERVQKSWDLSRIMMTNGEGLNVSEIIGSPTMLLEDLEAEGEDRFISVIPVTDIAVDKDYSSNGNQFVNLELQVKEVITRERR